MSFRTFGVQTLTGSAQPLFGDKLTAAMAIPKYGVDAIATVANTAIYQTGDRITVDPDTASVDTLLVTAILSSTTMQVSSQGSGQHAHAINAVIVLSNSCAELLVQLLDGGSGNAFLGVDNTVTNTGGGNSFYKLVKVASGTQPNVFRATDSATFNMVRTDDIWIAGSLSDTFLPSAEVV